MQIGLFFGSFNPIHIGHLIIANTMAESDWIDQVWFVVSPQNPFKKSSNLAHEHDRLEMVRLAIDENPKFNVTDIEFRMPKPSFTIDTLAYLTEKFPQHRFKLILGEDNLVHFHKWKNYEAILEHHELLIYPRPKVTGQTKISTSYYKIVEAPMIDISATFIRDSLQNGRSIRYLVPGSVADYMRGKHLYY